MPPSTFCVALFCITFVPFGAAAGPFFRMSFSLHIHYIVSNVSLPGERES